MLDTKDFWEYENKLDFHAQIHQVLTIYSINVSFETQLNIFESPQDSF